MKLLVVILVVISLAAAGVVSQKLENLNNGDEVIVKEGRRVIVVEYDKDGDENTRVSISSDREHHVSPKFSYVSSAEDSGNSKSSEEGESHGVEEIVCDALGKCKRGIGSVIGKGKDKVEEGKDVVGKVFDEKTTSEKVHYIGEGAEEAIERSAKEALDKVRRTGKTAMDMSVTGGGDVVRNVTEDVEIMGLHAVDTAKEANKSAGRTAEKVKKGAANVKEESKKGLSEILSHLWRYVMALETWGAFMNVVNLLGISLAYGMSVWVTFASSHVLVRALRRQQFVNVQSRIYPVYFRGMAYSIGMALLGHLCSQRKLVSSKPAGIQSCNLLASLVIVLINMIYLEPEATKLMFERMKMESEEGRGRDISDPNTAAQSPAPEKPEEEAVRSRISRLSERLKKLNSNSSILNISALMSLTWHLVYLAQCLHQI